MGRSKKSNKKRNNRKSKAEEKSYPSVVGPDLFLLLQGRLFDDGGATSSYRNNDKNQSGLSGGGKNVSLILCGESHNDAVDVTRRSPPGKFDPTEGWIRVFDSLQSNAGEDIYTALPRALFVSSRAQNSQSTSASTRSQQQPLPSIQNLALRFLFPVNGNRNKPVTLERAKELSAEFVGKYEIEEDMFGRNLFLLWISTTGNSGKTEKGEAFLLEIESEAQIDDPENEEQNNNNNNDDSDSDSDEESYNDWVFFTNDPSLYNNPIQQENRLGVPELVERWMDDVMMMVHDDDSTAATIDDAIDDMINEPDNDVVGVEDTNIVEGIDENGSAPVLLIQRRLMNSRLGRYVLFEFGDLDSVAYNLLKRRLGMTDAELTTNEYDDVIETRKRALKEQDNVWTFDDWFNHVKTEGKKPGDLLETNCDATEIIDPAIHLVLEASVPPWEVELHRPRLTEDGNASASLAKAEDFRLHPATECIRCLSEDSEAPWEDECDPSNDGIGSYVDYIYRKMMAATMKSDDKIENEQAVKEENTDNGGDGSNDAKKSSSATIQNTTIDDQQKNSTSNNSWLHCIDVRDLGCEAACHADSVKQQWYDLLSQDEQGILSNPKEVDNDPCPFNEKGDAMRFLPAYKLNPELIELERLKSEGLLVREEESDAEDGEPVSEYDRDEELLEFTFPSFESFFGSNTDILYYNPNVKLAYSPFLFHCVQSLDSWKRFFTALFFGGTIPDALAMLNLRDENSRNSVHVRSPILQKWDAESNKYIWKERDEEECYITCPFFPFAFHLVAKGSSPPRTWSSQLFTNLHDADGEGEIDHANPNSRRGVALAIKSWILDSIHRHMEDPKASDDKECGGEWFAAYLRAAHRDISDDIDNSDAAVLLQKNYMKSISGGRLKNHNIGKIRIPSARDAFEEIRARFSGRESLPPPENVVTPRVEVLSKILIDIWVSNLFDFSLLLKIASICAIESSENVVIVCYVGAAHARAASDFFSNKLGFKKKEQVGKFTWGEDELQTLDLPSKLWNFSELFR